jgi:hypothetical protein
VEALDQVRNGTPPLSPGLTAKLLNEFARANHPKKPVSSEKDRQEIMVLIYNYSYRWLAFFIRNLKIG